MLPDDGDAVASIQKKGDAWYCAFVHAKKRYTFAVGKVAEAEAKSVANRADYTLMRLRQGLLDIPDGLPVVDFIRFGGKAPRTESREPPEPAKRTPMLADLREAYLAAHSSGAVETNTLSTGPGPHHPPRRHLRGEVPARRLRPLGPPEARCPPEVAPMTVRKEVATLKTAWPWAVSMGGLLRPFPAGELAYRKEEEKLPCMSWAEIERPQVAAGGDLGALWDCLYLDTDQMDELLAYMETAKGPRWIYAMFCTAAHTGMRRFRAGAGQGRGCRLRRQGHRRGRRSGCGGSAPPGGRR